MALTTILDKIVATKQRELDDAKGRISLRDLETRLSAAQKPRNFRGALEVGPEIQVIAEVKKASPSAGVLRTDFDPVAIARTYSKHGAAAISVLTDAAYFGGDLYYLTTIRAAVPLPLLRKDFILDRYQLLEARTAGADAILLIAEILPGQALADLVREARRLELEPLVEFYETENLARVLDSGAKLVGVNNRDLRTFETRLEHTLELAGRVPGDVCLISESGIRNHQDIRMLKQAGVRAILVGETLMRAPDIGAKLDELLDSR
jgi:indole-3-glycerol phosphate synthase